MQCVWLWSSKPLLMVVSILLGVVTIKFAYCLCFEREIWERVAWRWRWLLLSVFWRLAGFSSVRSAVALMQDLQELCMYNNGKHWTLKQYQVTCNFAPPGTTGQPTPRGRGLPYGAPYPHAQLVPWRLTQWGLGRHYLRERVYLLKV